jgi:4-hydroxy-tetrahydrodipicolinate synthase
MKNDLYKIRGSLVALATPFTMQGDIDIPALRQLVKRQIEGGTAAIIPCGTTGEASTLSDREFETVVGTVVEVSAGAVPVIAGAGSNSTDRVVELGRIAKSVGAQGLLVVTPYYNKPTAEGLFEHYKKITSEVQLPTIIYNVPGRTGSNVLPDTILKISSLEYVYAVKEASGSIMQAMEIIEKRDAKFLVYTGDDSLALPTIAVGGDGLISVAANQIPREMADLCSSALKNDFERAQAIHYRYLSLMQANFMESNPIPVKYALAKMGLIQEAYRLPLVPLKPENKERMDKILKNIELTR